MERKPGVWKKVDFDQAEGGRKFRSIRNGTYLIVNSWRVEAVEK